MTLPTIPAQSMELASVSPASLQLNILTPYLPIITGAPTISGTIEIGEVLTATAAPVQAYPESTRVFRWQRSDTGTGSWTTIQDSNTYTIALADENKYLRVVQRETNTLGTSVSASASTTQVPSAFTGILDTYGSNIGAAYSVRLLSKTYTGDCMEIRRASDNATQNIGFSDNVLDTSAIASFCSGTSGYVRTWYDQSGNGKHVQQTTATQQPRIFNEGSVVTLNNKPALDGYVDDGSTASDQHLTIPENGEVTLPDTGFDIFMVMQFDNFYGFGVSKVPSSGLNDRVLLYNNQIRLTIDSTNQTWSGSSGLRNTQRLFEFYNDNGTASVYSNGSQYTEETKSLPEGSTFNFNTIGTNNNQRTFQYMQEVLLYTKHKSQRADITTNMNDHFDVYE